MNMKKYFIAIGVFLGLAATDVAIGGIGKYINFVFPCRDNPEMGISIACYFFYDVIVGIGLLTIIAILLAIIVTKGSVKWVTVHKMQKK